MPHELELDESGGARMFYAGEAPWHGLGVGVEDAATSAEAIALAGLGGWSISLERFASESSIQKYTLSQNPEDLIWAEDWRSMVRTGLDGKILGVATEAYRPIQNERAFDFLDSLVADRVMRYETAGSLMGGRKIWILARLDSDVRVGDDRYIEYLLLVMGHDNFTSLRIYTTKVRVVCNNTLLQATRRAESAVRITHAGNLENKFTTARTVLNVTTETQLRMTEWLNRLARKKVTEDEVIQVRDKIFGSLDDVTQKRRRTAVENWMRVYEAEREREGRTAYTVLQTITGYGDHFLNLRERPDGEQRLRSALDGSGQSFKKKGIQILTSVVNVPAFAGMFASE